MVKRIVMADDVTGEFDGVVKDQLNTAIVQGIEAARPWSPEMFGAVGNGTADDREAIQDAIDAANAAYVASGVAQVVEMRGAYSVSAVDYLTDAAVIFGSTSLKMRDGVHIRGNGTIRVEDAAYGSGAFYRCFSSRDSTRLSHASIRGITIDGNRANQPASTQCSNIVLECLDDVTVEGVRSVNANGQGIMLRGTTTSFATNLKIMGNTVANSSYIGIQSSQFDGLVIADNQITDSVDNAIDVYGEDGTTATHGRNFTITGNVIDGANVGVFLETVSDGTVSGNSIRGSTRGVHTNRINGEPTGLVVSGNAIADCGVGVSVSGDMGSLLITGNTVVRATVAAVELGVGGGNVGSVAVNGNHLECVGASPLVKVTAPQAAFIRSTGNTTKSATATQFALTITTEVYCVWHPAHALEAGSDVVYLDAGAAGVSFVQWSGGTGSPEGVVTAPVGSFYSRTDGGASTTLYVKTSGSGNTGWTAK